MRTAFAVFRKDLAVYFKSVSAYVSAAVFLAISGYLFFWELKYFSVICYRIASSPYLENRGYNLTEAVLGTFFMNMGVLLLLLLPALTMRTFAEERKQGTLESLLTYPSSDGGILLGKFCSAWVAALFMVLPTGLYVWLAYLLGGRFDLAVLCSAYGGLFLLVGSFAALGVLTSMITESQWVGFAVSFGFLVFLWMIGRGAELANPEWAHVLRSMSLLEHYRHFTKGIIHGHDVVYFALFISFFLLMAKELLGARRWAS